MPNICLLIGTSASPSQALSALTTIEGLSNWWTTHTFGSTAINNTIEFRFPENGIDMQVIKSTDTEVTWKCLNGPDEWIGTHIHFKIEHSEVQTLIIFKHEGWAKEVPFIHHCSMKWAVFLLSLKEYLETGTGKPFPHDTHIELG